MRRRAPSSRKTALSEFRVDQCRHAMSQPSREVRLRTETAYRRAFLRQAVATAADFGGTPIRGIGDDSIALNDPNNHLDFLNDQDHPNEQAGRDPS